LIYRNKQLLRADRKPILYDIYLSNRPEISPLVVFVHGFKGYKDWGNWNDFAHYFQENGIHFLKFNFSHNGGTLHNPIDFPDLEAFSNNTYSKELDDLGDILDFAEIYFREELKMTYSELVLIGHSRGGAITVLKAVEDKRVGKLVCLAAVSDFQERFNAYDLETWKGDGVIFIKNSRTNQEMPIKYSFYEDFLQNQTRLDICNSARSLDIPSLIIHARNDSVVGESDALNLNDWIKDSELFLVQDGGHTFGMKQPKNEMPIQMKELSNKIKDFII